MFLRSHFECQSDVTLRTRGLDGRIVQEVHSSNIIINTGRKYLRDVVSAKSYGSSSTDTPPVTPTYSDIVPWTYHRTRFVALGTGGILQTSSYPGVGTYVEQVSTRGLERPVPVTYRVGGLPGHPECQWQWVKQVEPQDGAEELPDDFSAVYRAIFGYSEVSFASQIGEFNNVVPISEVLLLTSAAEAYVTAPTPAAQYRLAMRNGSTYPWPDLSRFFPGCNGDVPGAMAYNLTTPIFKTPNVTLEILWELRS